MKSSSLKFLLIAFLLLRICDASAQIIKTKTPKRDKGQTDVLRLATPAIPVVHVAIIGLGMRGTGAVERITHIPGVEIVALCDMLEDRTKAANDTLVKHGMPKAETFFGEDSWKKVTSLKNVDLVYIVTDWKHHASIAVQAMKDGKHVAVEVPGALTMDEIWDIINTSEKTRKHCMMLENCVYDFFELTTLNMAQQGVFGEILHAEGSYIHGLQPYWGNYWNNWRMDYNRKHRGDIYPTHGMGPACLALNIHRGDKMNFLVSMDTKAVGNPAFIKEKTGEVVTDFRNGDHTMTMIRTEKGKTIQIQHDVTSPRPYSRMYQLTGTKGFANKYPIEGYAIDAKEVGTEISKDYQNLNAEEFVSEDVKKLLMEKYKNPIVKDIEEKAKKVGGHGGMDFIMDYRMFYCIQNGLPLDMDVYDLAEWSCLSPLTEISLDNNSSPVEIPDFTRGGWQKLKTVEFSK
ncbi:Gfo/Idh/MocA family oxidoreductase [Flavobacterium sp. ANB]|uniref:Gfo/Idh/MocA family protein n=1 Tax=unclassified Flavobacterium TaxID=196869 RepID=UPI0012B9C663|nr:MULTISPECIES: Gfo/Idh/MocA family oxidoreductase [unclassified Flavobacterium]MBF4517021.1 Gfo/Idh/MocA family oxidoreductase [Flavobacterium sp. ANB]MTD69083.1 glycosyl hydrolase [Flavobacterium sp. LC2016-13]